MLTTRGPLNAFLDLPGTAVGNAPSGPLAGSSLAVKDIFDVAGYPTGCGNPDRFAAAQPAATTAPAVAALLDAGARFVGKTQTDELAFSLFGRNHHLPFPVNPKAPDRIAGGSSSGSAAAVAGGLVDIATGSDTGGSIRAPASFCGLVGLRTTHGAISLDGTMPLAPSFDTFGWFARDGELYERVAEVLLGRGEGAAAGSTPALRANPSQLGDPKSREGRIREPGREPPLRLASLDTSPPVPEGEDGSQAGHRSSPHSRGRAGKGKARAGEGVRWRPLRLAALDALVLLEAAGEYARIAGVVAEVVGAPFPASLTDTEENLYWCFRRLQAHEAWQSHGAWIAGGDRRLGPGVKQRFDYGASIDDETVLAETARRGAFRAELLDLLSDDGVLILPTVPGPAPLVSSSPDELDAYRARALHLLCLSGLSGLPQITLPLGQVNGAPFGISLLGPSGSDLALVRLARKVLELG